MPHGGVKRSSGAPNSSYFTQWSKTDDTITWDIDVHQTGNYKVENYYTCPPADAGSQVELSFNHARITGKVTPGWDPPLQDKEDRAPRILESYWKDFHSLTLGTMRLKKGRGPLTLRALEIPGRQVMDMRLMALTLEQP